MKFTLTPSAVPCANEPEHGPVLALPDRRWLVSDPSHAGHAVRSLGPGLAASAALWALAGAGTAYQLAANVAFVTTVPDTQRAQAFGLVATGQGVGIVAAGGLADLISPDLVITAAGAAATVLAVSVALAARRR